MKIAVAARGNNVDDHFGHCEHFRIFDINSEGKIVSEDRITPPEGCGCMSGIVNTLYELGVAVMIAGNMGDGAVMKLNSFGIDVVRGCQGDPKEVVGAFIGGTLVDNGVTCGEHHHGCGHHH